MKQIQLAFICVFLQNLWIINAYRTFDVDGEETILAFENEKIKIQCKSDFPMIYCGFVNPRGARFSFTDLGVHAGRCVHEIKAKKTDSGEWKCHIGRKTERLETIKRIQVRVVKQLAAVKPNITTKYGKSITLSCATTGGFIPLSYCRFEPPNGKSFSIDPTVTEANPILGKYYFPSNSSLDRGDCCVTIRKVKAEDVGLWTCGAGMEDGNEHTDIIRVEIEGMYAMSTASATGVTIGGIIIAATMGLLGYVAWKKWRLLGVTQQEPEAMEMEHRAETPSPRPFRAVPGIVVQSPSTPGSSPLMSSTRS
ncbi:unnamed protein product [Colias eurytheme]|nr:unnamed protein product [Colias eurytheme]